MNWFTSHAVQGRGGEGERRGRGGERGEGMGGEGRTWEGREGRERQGWRGHRFSQIWDVVCMVAMDTV